MGPLLRLLPALAMLSLLGACAAQGSFPSLAPRAVERDLAGSNQPVPPCLADAETAEPAPAPPSAPAAADPVLMSRLDQLRTSARAGDQAFETTMAKAGTAVAGAGDAGSESWIAAQVAVSEAEMARTPTVTALAELTSLALEETTQPANPLDQQAIEAAAAETQALAERQAERLEGLKASLSDL